MKKYIILILIVVIIGAVILYYHNAPSSTAPAYQAPSTAVSVPATTATTTIQLMTATTQLFASSADYSKSYKIFPGALSSQATTALSGFALSTTDLGNGVTQVNLTAKESQYHSQSFVVGPGQSVYFIEKSLGDDGNDSDANYGDDYGVAVDANGYILQ